VLDALTNRFGIDVADLGDRADVEARISEVLDS
jgi:arylamine N-acetyltransferase